MKQKFKRLFIVFGVLLVFTLLLTIRTPTHAYNSENMPTGYRLLTEDDVHKTFGTDLELLVYFDVSLSQDSIYLGTSSISLTNFITYSYEESYDEGLGMTFEYVRLYFSSSPNLSITNLGWQSNGMPGSQWTYESYTFSQNTELTFFNTSVEWNNWLYVKDISNTCYTEEDLENARTEGYNEGYTAGVNSVNTQDYYNAGYTAGSTDGYNEGYDVGYQAGVDSIDTQDYYNQGYTAASDDFLVFENLIFGTMNGFTRTIQSLFDFQIFGISVFGLIGGLVGIAFGIGLIILIIKVVKIFT